MHNIKIHDFELSYGEGRPLLEKGAKYLQSLDKEEVTTLFEGAKRNDRNHEAYFEDRERNNFEILYKESNKYLLRYRE